MKKIIMLVLLACVLPTVSALELGKLTQTELDKITNMTAENFHCGYERNTFQWNFYGFFSILKLKQPAFMTATAGCYRVYRDGENYVVKDDVSPINLGFLEVGSCIRQFGVSQCMGNQFSSYFNEELDTFELIVKREARQFQTAPSPFTILENQMNIRWR